MTPLKVKESPDDYSFMNSSMVYGDFIQKRKNATDLVASMKET